MEAAVVFSLKRKKAVHGSHSSQSFLKRLVFEQFWIEDLALVGIFQEESKFGVEGLNPTDWVFGIHYLYF